MLAVGHRLIVIAYYLLAEPVPYKELGGDYIDRLHPEHTRRRLVRRLERLSHAVVLTTPAPPPDAAPSPSKSIANTRLANLVFGGQGGEVAADLGATGGRPPNNHFLCRDCYARI